MNTNTILAAIDQHANIHVQVATRTGSHFMQVSQEAARGLATAAGHGELGMLSQHGILYIGAAAPQPTLGDGQHTTFGNLPVGSSFRFLPGGTFTYIKLSTVDAKRAGRPAVEVGGNRAVMFIS